MNPIETVRQELRSMADPAWQEKTRRFFREDIDPYGVPNGDVRKLSRYFYPSLAKLSKDAIFDLCDELFRSGKHEECLIACDWSMRPKKHFTPTDLARFSGWIDRYVTNWAICDTFCNHTVGTVLAKFPELLPELLEWTSDANRWKRRAAAVSLVVPAKKGLFLDTILAIATAMLTDSDDMVQKGYGWMLKEASMAHSDAIFDFVMEHKQHMPRTALRYAIEKLPPYERQEAMKK